MRIYKIQLNIIFKDGAWTHSSELIDQVAKLIQQAIDNKGKKLVNINVPKILIIRDTLMLTDNITYQKAIPNDR